MNKVVAALASTGGAGLRAAAGAGRIIRRATVFTAASDPEASGTCLLNGVQGRLVPDTALALTSTNQGDVPPTSQLLQDCRNVLSGWQFRRSPNQSAFAVYDLDLSRVGINKTALLPEEVLDAWQVSRIRCRCKPAGAGLGMAHPRIERSWRLAKGRHAEGQQQHAALHLVGHAILHRFKNSGFDRADAGAAREHELDRYGLPLDEVVQADTAFIAGDQADIRNLKGGRDPAVACRGLLRRPASRGDGRERTGDDSTARWMTNQAVMPPIAD